MDKLPNALQENILTVLCFYDDHAEFISNSVEIELFDSAVYREIAGHAIGYIEKFHKAPNDHIADLMEHILTDKNKKKAQLYEEILHSLYASKDGLNVEYVLSQLSSFVRQQRLKSGLTEAVTAVKNGDLDGAENILTASLEYDLTAFEPGIFLNDTRNSLEFLRNPDVGFLTGIADLDKRGLGPARKELHLFLAPPKRGKCIAYNQEVLLSDGSLDTIENIVKNKHKSLTSYNEVTGRFEKQKIAEYWDNGLKHCYEVTTITGRKVITTGNHPFLTPNGWINLENLSVGSHIGVPLELPIFGKKSLGDLEVMILAYMIADGCTIGTASTYTKKDKKIKRDFEKTILAYGDSVTWVSTITCYVVTNKELKGKHSRNNTRKLLDEHGLLQVKSKNKKIPNAIFTLPKDELSLFLRTLFTGDGSIYGSVIEYSSASEKLIEQLQHLLTRFGIITRRRHLKPKCNGKQFEAWGLYIKGKKQLLRFSSVIGFLDSSKALRLKKLVKKLELVEERFSYGLRRTDSEFLVWDKIKNIKPVGKLKTYDLSINETHNFIANNILVHNTWWLVHLAKHSLLQHRKVLHVTLEMSEPKMLQRYFQSLFSISKRETKEIPVSNFEFDDMGTMIDLNTDYIKRPSFEDRAIRKLLVKKMDAFHNQFSLLVKQFPTGSLTIKGLKAYLTSLERNYNFIPDLLILDYADLMAINTNQIREETGQIYKHLRGIAVERNIAIATASQSNRTSTDVKIITDKHVAEDFSKIATADCVITYNQTEHEKNLNLARLFVANGRNDEDKFSILISQCYALGQFCLDNTYMHENYWQMIETSEVPD